MATGKGRKERERRRSVPMSVIYYFINFKNSFIIIIIILYIISKFWGILTHKEILVEFTIEKKFQKFPNFFVL